MNLLILSHPYRFNLIIDTEKQKYFKKFYKRRLSDCAGRNIKKIDILKQIKGDCICDKDLYESV